MSGFAGNGFVGNGFFGHGGRLAQACAQFGGEPGDWLDLSTGINPDPWPIPAKFAPDWSRLPDPDDLARLEATAARYFGVDPALCCAVPGSELGLRLIADGLGMPGCHVPPCYGSHADAFALSRPVFSPADLPPTPCVTVLANPNNPDGRVWTGEALHAWLDAATARAGWLIIDEAFADAVPHVSVASQVAEHRRLIVLRSFGKFFGLAGARLGFVIAPPSVVAQVRFRIGDWPVNAGALALGQAAYADAHWIAATRAALPHRAAQLDAVLSRHDLTPHGGSALFRLVKTTAAATIFDRLAQWRILTRPFADNAQWLRFGLTATDADLAWLDAALDSACG